jgi:hypothetical protein
MERWFAERAEREGSDYELGTKTPTLMDPQLTSVLRLHTETLPDKLSCRNPGVA